MAAPRKANLIDLKELGLEKQTYTIKELLTTDSFRLPTRKFEDQKSQPEKCIILGDGYAIPEKAYQELYGEIPIWNYQETPEDKSKQEEKKPADKIIVNPEKYKEQFSKLIDNIINWGVKNNINAAELSNLESLKISLFQSEYSSHQTTHYFISYKQSLEKIWYIFTKKDNIPLDIKISKLKTLNNDVGVCDSGAYTNVLEITNELIVDRSVEALLSKLRRNIADNYANKYTPH